MQVKALTLFCFHVVSHVFFINHIYLIPQSSIPPSTYFVHRPGSESLQQPAQHRSILQRRLEERLGIRDAFLGRLQDPQRYEPRYRLLGRIHGWVSNVIKQQQRHSSASALPYLWSVRNETGGSAPPCLNITVGAHWLDRAGCCSKIEKHGGGNDA